MSSSAFDPDGELSPEARQAILDHRDKIEALAESDTAGAEVAKALLRKI